MKDDKKYYDHPFGNISIDDVRSKIDECDNKVEHLQEDFFNTLLELIDGKDNEDGIERERDRIYYVRKMKSLQKQINHQLNYSKQLSMDLARTSLEEAFTPHVKSMLIDSYQKKIEELENEDV
tara:strand:+ start:69 stop:437 length:369 start_codon:yes stop_codon:yes gene_type:complete